MPKKHFVISDETKNHYGFKVSNKGLDFETRFRGNPVGFHNHDTNRLPIAKWSNWNLLADKWIATPEFDESDDFALEVQGKIERGFLNATSLGLFPVRWEEIDGEYWLMEAQVIEISTANVPSNGNSIRLYQENQQGELVCLSMDQTKEFLNKQVMSTTKNKVEEMNEESLTKRIEALEGGVSEIKDAIGKIALSLQQPDDQTQKGEISNQELKTSIENLTNVIQETNAKSLSASSLIEALSQQKKPEGADRDFSKIPLGQRVSMYLQSTNKQGEV